MSTLSAPTVVSPTSPHLIPRERIAMRAYEKWCQRGCTHGHDMQDWLEAEAELQSDVGKQKKATSAIRPSRR